MILVDFSQTFIAAVMAITINGGVPVEEGLIRHVALKMLRSYNQKFGKEYGEMVICCDHYKSWRKEIFPYYKAHRKVVHDKSPVDWNGLYDYLAIVIDEIDKNFPYRVIKVEGAEGDDVIGTMVRNRPERLMGDHEPTLIISGDEDFCQLQVYDNVRQYYPLKKKIIDTPNPKEFLLEHIICGDAGDGVPNILNPDNAIVDKFTKKKMTAGRLVELKNRYKSSKTTIAQDFDYRFERNSKLIDLLYTPMELQRQIVSVYNGQSGKDRKKIYPYLMKMRLKDLMGVMGDF
jgi:hypothetical protein